MASKKRTPEQNKAIYQRRKQRAINEGYAGYGQKRYKVEKEKKKANTAQQAMAKLEEAFPGIVHIDSLPLSHDRQKAYDRLVDSGRYSQSDLNALRNAPHEDYWPLYRTLYERIVT
jgi:hypothetical protein